jgi:hypothetical protein
MKKAFFILFTAGFSVTNFAQDNIDQLLAAGVNDAKRFTSDYIAPAAEGLSYGINNGWFNHGKSPRRFGFEISIIANATFVKDEHKSFAMNSSDYENIRFSDNSTSKNVATALGQNDPEITVIITYDDPIFGNQEAELTLPTGIGSANVNLIPAAFVQASFSPFKGTQIKGRFFPKTQIEDAEIGLYGVGLQQEFTSWLPADKIFPVAISGLVAYTHLEGEYDFTEDGFVAGENQKVQTEVNTILAQLIVSTKLKIINFYGGIGYLSGKSTTSLLGSYKVSNGILFSEEIVNPYSIKQDASGVRGTLGANLKLGLFGLNADYTMAEFASASLGLNFSF